MANHNSCNFRVYSEAKICAIIFLEGVLRNSYLLKYQTYNEEIKFPDESPLNVKLIEAMTDYPDVSANEISSDNELITVNIYTGPSGAEITLMGESGTLTGTSPVSFEVVPGKYNIRATRPNYKNYQEVYTIDQDGMDITIQLESVYSLYGN